MNELVSEIDLPALRFVITLKKNFRRVITFDDRRNNGEIKIMKKLLSILFFIAVFYVLPLIIKPQLLFNWQVMFLAGICTILFATQPRFSVKESRKKKLSDRNTVWLILIVSAVGQIISLIEWAYFPNHLFVDWFTILGALMLIGGTTFRLHAIRTLGKFFTSIVQVKEEHRIIETGPYKVLRHPSYTGAYIAMLGCALFLHSIGGIITFGIGMLLVYRLRIDVEEAALINRFQEDYKKYQRKTYKMFPYIW
jgi:protein-S-isoprenylcysteine O-methyltransferase Ste14